MNILLYISNLDLGLRRTINLSLGLKMKGRRIKRISNQSIIRFKDEKEIKIKKKEKKEMYSYITDITLLPIEI